MADRSITVRLRLQDDYSAPLRRAAGATDDFSGEAEKSGGILDKIKGKFSDLVGGADGLKDALAGVAGGFAGGIIGGGIAEGIGGIAESMMGAIDAASDLNETVNKSQAIFGAQAGAVEQWSNSAATSFGLSKAEALDYAASLGDMFTQLGNTGAQSAKMSEKTIQLAADLGSFSNLDTGDVLDRITAAFRGEYDSLQAIVPNINAARVQTEAMTETGKKSAAQLTAQEKATATLNIITKDTSRAQGDFAKTAHQAANQQKINAAQVKDLQAKIGQGLLPAYRAFLNLIGNVGLPALSSLVDMGGAVVSSIGPMVDAFNGLPGPVKEAAAALLAIGLANRVFGSRLTGIGGKVRVFGGTLRQMSQAQGAIVRTSQGAAVQMGRFGSAIERAGQHSASIARMQSAFVGAAAGARRFPRAAGAAAAAMSGIRSAGRGLVNFLGGPFGVAMIGAGLLLMAWQKHQQDAAAAAAAHKAKVEELTSAIKEDGDQIGKSTNEYIAHDIVTSGLADKAKDYGISLRTLAGAYRGNKTDIDSLNKSLEENGSHQVVMNRAQQETGKSTRKLTDDAAAFQKQVLGSTGAVKEAVQAAKDQKKIEDALNTTHQKAATSTDEYSEAQKRAAAATKAADKAAKDMVSALDKVNNKFLELRGGQRGYEAAIDDATAALKKNGKTLDINTAKGRENANALDTIASSAQSVLKEMGDKGMSAASIASEYKRQHAELVKMAEAFGMNAAEAKKYADQALTLPKEVKTSYDLDVSKAKAGLAAARAAAKALGVDFDSLPASVQTKLATTGGKDAKKIIKEVTDTANGAPRGLHIKTDTPGADDSNVRLKKLTVTAITADGKAVSIPVSTPKQAQALHDLLAIDGAAVKADGRSISIPSSTPLSKRTIAELKSIDGVAVTANRKSVSISTSAPGALTAAARILAAGRDADRVNGKYSRIVIETIHRHVTEELFRRGGNINGNNGLVFAPGGGRRMANGGVTRQATIAPAGSWITWAEDETGGESYIPWALSKRRRSEQILGVTAQAFGYDLVKQVRHAADGYMSWRDARPVQSSSTVVVRADSGGSSGLTREDRQLLRQYITTSQQVLQAMPDAVKSGLDGRARQRAQSAHLLRKMGGA